MISATKRCEKVPSVAGYDAHGVSLGHTNVMAVSEHVPALPEPDPEFQGYGVPLQGQQAVLLQLGER
jgi:hypothetical protein